MALIAAAAIIGPVVRRLSINSKAFPTSWYNGFSEVSHSCHRQLFSNDGKFCDVNHIFTNATNIWRLRHVYSKNSVNSNQNLNYEVSNISLIS